MPKIVHSDLYSISARFCVAVRREMYPEDQTYPGLLPLPGHTVIVMPPVTVCNLLPIDLQYYLKGTEISGNIKPGTDTQLHAVCLDDFFKKNTIRFIHYIR